MTNAIMTSLGSFATKSFFLCGKLFFDIKFSNYLILIPPGVMGEKEGWKLCMDINLTGVLHGTNLAIRWKILFYPTLNVL